MQSIITEIRNLFSGFSSDFIKSVEKLPESGSDRTYFRILTEKGSFIATYNLNRKENNVFIAFSRHFKSAGAPVPLIYASNADQSIYIQEDFGNESLLNKLEQHGYTDPAYQLFKKSLKALAQMQMTRTPDRHFAGITYKDRIIVCQCTRPRRNTLWRDRRALFGFLLGKMFELVCAMLLRLVQKGVIGVGFGAFQQFSQRRLRMTDQANT